MSPLLLASLKTLQLIGICNPFDKDNRQNYITCNWKVYIFIKNALVRMGPEIRSVCFFCLFVFVFCFLVVVVFSFFY